ncbi:hypothetical protein [Niabella drilacis]|uniref:DUF445 domain-containing protein n=1 Tax=Niabella drilacis (strain DSM 25811 / CCM 8410 / CCUG 62505 / LMG 26954 / E90) TaxID=1285928 RepID=A0A1G6W538_NIADE|nr:hypothetical protein [Niabella drilacis]SDD60908.1 hypothetical protein SAMN04487894_1114 [Niabella drilacis]
MSCWLFLILPVSAFAGWLIHWIAGNYFMNRYLPRQDAPLAAKAGHWAGQLMKQSFNIEQKISDPALIEKAMPSIEKHIDDFLNVKLKEEIPMLAMFIGNKTTDKIREVFIDQLKTLFPQVMLQLTANLKNELNPEQIVTRQLTEKPLSSLMKKDMAAQLRRYRNAGLLYGLVIGLVNLVLLCFVL